MMIDRLGGWPVLQANKQPKDEEMNVTLLSMYQKLVHHGLADDMLVLITVIPHATNFSRNMLAVGAGTIIKAQTKEFHQSNLGIFPLGVFPVIYLFPLLGQTFTTQTDLGAQFRSARP